MVKVNQTGYVSDWQTGRNEFPISGTTDPLNRGLPISHIALALIYKKEKKK